MGVALVYMVAQSIPKLTATCILTDVASICIPCKAESGKDTDRLISKSAKAACFYA
jgi:hypothetical protein